jgi:hypothetical protein
MNKDKKIIKKKIRKMSKGKIINWILDILRISTMIILRVILIMKTNEFTKLFRKAPFSPFFFAW